MNGTLPKHLENTSEANGHAINQRLIPQVADEIARANPDRVYASVPYSADLSQGFRDVTFAELVNAVNYLAWWLDGRLGRSKTFETISYMGPSDLRYTIIFLAAVKCGYTLLVPSIRNSLSMNIYILSETKCTKFFYSSEMDTKVQEMQDANPNLECYLLPPADDLLHQHSKHYSYGKTYSEAERDKILICHTSGSTGSPKPIALSNGAFMVWDNHRNIPRVPGRKNQDYSLFNFSGGGRFYSSFPPFHLAGFVNTCVLPIFYDATCVLGPPDRPASGQLISQIMDHYTLRGIFAAPALFEQLLQEPEGLKQLSGLDWILYTGGPLSPAAGDALSEVTDVCQIYGQTETGVIAALVPTRENWSFFEFHPAYGQEMQLADEDVYEMVIPRDLSRKWIRGVCHTFPDVEEWRMRDLFKRHPSKPNLWRFHGRTDDILVLSNGEKFNPVQMEGIIQGHTLVSGALIVGQGRFQAALLVEPRQAVDDRESFVDDIWPVVQQANSEGPGHAKILRSKIIITSPDKPFSRAGKGTVIRGVTTKLYTDEIQSSYDNDVKGLKDVPPLDRIDKLATVSQWVHSCMALFFPDLKVSDGEDLFSHGLDSLQTVELVSGLKAGLSAHARITDLDWLSTKVVYQNPSVIALSKSLHDHLNSKKLQNGVMNSNREDIMAKLVDRYTQDLFGKPKTKPPKRKSKLSVVLTGSTGSLGTHLLQVLLDDPNVTRIYCLNRSADAEQRHAANFAQRGLAARYDLKRPQIILGPLGIGCEINPPKAEFLKVDFGYPTFGLTAKKYSQLTKDVDVIIHNAWKVDFNHSLESFEETHIRGVRNFIDWSTSSQRRPHIFFVSSISSVGNWCEHFPEQRFVPETPAIDYGVAQEIGYGESKHVSERILDIAAVQAGVPVTILRVGQIAGPLATDGGEWNKTEWVPCLVKTSKTLGLIPDSIPDIDWIPVDNLANIVLELVHYGAFNPIPSNKPRIYNLVNPNLAAWSSLIPTIRSRFGTEAKIVPTEEWIQALRNSKGDDKDELATKPALKILDFYVGLAEAGGVLTQRYETGKGVEDSETMERLSGVKREWMEGWLDQWDF